MKISLQSKVNYKEIYPRRRKMIREEGLHMQDSIDYFKFRMLHNIYAGDLTEEEFARYFLDVEYESYYKLSRQIKNKIIILSREYYEPEEFVSIKKEIFSKENFSNFSISYDRLVDIYIKYGDRFTLKMFAYEVLGIDSNSLENLKKERDSTTKINKKTVNYKQIDEVRKKIVSDKKLYINKPINYVEFKELFTQYPIKDMNEIEYAYRELGLSYYAYQNIKNNQEKIAFALKNYPIDPNSIAKIRETLIKNENLHIGDEITSDRFLELYEKYGGILSKEIFSIEILDVKIGAIRKAEKNNKSSEILTKINVTEEYIKDLREQVIKQENLKFNQQINYKKLQKLYAKYGFPLSEIQFAIDILGIQRKEYYYSLRSGKTKLCFILSDSKIVDFTEIRKRVIEENALHYEDRITYQQIKKLHAKYAKSTRENVFAREVLDIGKNGLDYIRTNKKWTTPILLEEKLPSGQEIQDIKKNVRKKYNLHKRDSINFKQFKVMYDNFGGIMPMEMFAEQILEIAPCSLAKIRLDPKEKTRVYNKTKISEEDIGNLRRLVIKKYRLYPGKILTLNDIQEIYNNIEHTLSFNDFSLKVLRINHTVLFKLKKGEIDEGVVFQPDLTLQKRNDEKQKKITDAKSKIDLIQGIYRDGRDVEDVCANLFISYSLLENIIKEFEEQGLINKEACENERIVNLANQGLTPKQIEKITFIDIARIRTIIKKYSIKKEEKYGNSLKKRKEALKIVENIFENPKDTPKNRKKILKYIALCRESIKIGSYDFKELDMLRQAIEFVEGGEKEICVYIRICIQGRLYDEAISMISLNIDNKGITEEEKDKLYKIRTELLYAKKLQKALKEVDYNATYDQINTVASDNGVRIIDILRFKKMNVSKEGQALDTIKDELNKKLSKELE